MVIWPDFMHSKPNVLLSRLAHFNGNSNSIYGRDTSIVMPANTMSNDFHSQHHLLGGLEGKRNIGLSYQSSLVGLASFSRPCPIDRDGQKFTSIELNRVSFKSHHHIPGGLTRMIKAAETQFGCDDIMTKIDLDFGLASFKISDVFTPFHLFINSEHFVALHDCFRFFIARYNFFKFLAIGRAYCE